MSNYLKVLFLNTFLMPPGLAPHKTVYKDARLNYMINYIFPNYDILLLCEVFDAKLSGILCKISNSYNRTNHLIDEMNHRGFNHIHRASPTSLSKICNSGLLIISKHPIQENTELIFKTSGLGSEYYVSRGVLYAKICDVLFFLTHLQSDQVSIKNNSRGYGDTVRRRQLLELSEFIEFHKNQNKGDLCILAGDMNINAIDDIDNMLYDGTRKQSEEYLDMLRLLNAEDIYAKLHKSNPVTYGNVDHNGDPEAVDLTCEDEQGSCQTLDYIFQIKNSLISDEDDYEVDDFQEYLANQRSERKCKIHDIKIEPFYTTSEEFSQASDHYGIFLSLEMKPTKN